MKIKSVLLASVAAVAAASVASADGLPERARYKHHHERGCANFAGFYFGGNVGWANRTSDTVERELIGTSLFNETTDGFTGGAQAGYNFQRGCALWGFETDINWAGVDSHRNYNAFGLGPILGGPILEDRRSTDWYGTLRTRTGVVVDNLLIYATGGLAFADFQHRLDVPLIPFNVFNTSDTRWGWTVGGGVEWALTSAISIKSETLYMQFEDRNINVPIAGPFALNLTDRDSMWVSRVGLNFRFGAREEVVPLK